MRRLLCAALLLAAMFSAQSALAGTIGTRTAVTATPTAVVEGATITFTATVTPDSGTEQPTGSVNVYLGSTLEFSIPLSNGKGSFTAPSSGIPAGAYTLQGQYAGDSTFGASSGSVQVDIKSPTTVATQAVPNPVVAGENITLQSTVTSSDGGGNAGGSMSFYVASTLLATVNVSANVATLKASSSGYAPGTYPVVAKYSGDNLHGASQSSPVNVVLQAAGGTACGTGSESLLLGTYVFSMDGHSSGNETPYFIAGAFVADGSGGIEGGEQDINTYHSFQHESISSISSYSVGADMRGCLTLAAAGTSHTYRFALSNIGAQTAGTAFFGRIIEFDDTNGSGTRATGGMIQNTVSQLGLSNLQATYSLGVDGFGGSGSIGRAGLIGNFAISTSGAISTGITDSNFEGTELLDQAMSNASLTSIDGYGRSVLTFTSAQGQTFSFAAYEINRDHFFVVSSNASGSVPVMDGEMHYAATGFTASNLYPTWVEHLSGTTPNASSYEQVLARTVFNTDGKYSSTRYEYSNGSASTVTDSGSFTVSSAGRVVLNSSAGGTPEILYMFYKGSTSFPSEGAYVLGLESPLAVSGSADEQVANSYSDSALAGSYVFGHDVLLEGTENAESGEGTLSSAGTLTGTVDKSGSSGLTPDAALSVGPFDFSSTGVSSGSGLTAIATGSDIYVLVENGELNPLFDLGLQ